MLSRHPELARKMKANSAGERVLDEKAITAAGAILRKENRAEQDRGSTGVTQDAKLLRFVLWGNFVRCGLFVW